MNLRCLQYKHRWYNDLSLYRNASCFACLGRLTDLCTCAGPERGDIDRDTSINFVDYNIKDVD